MNDKNLGIAFDGIVTVSRYKLAAYRWNEDDRFQINDIYVWHIFCIRIIISIEFGIMKQKKCENIHEFNEC